MTVLVWDKVGDRKHETGLDRGVLYLPDGSAVPWNGLTSVIESFNKESAPVYYDGMKINDLVTLGDFSATMKAITYPDEFVEFEGLDSAKLGVFYSNQNTKMFGLCYRTKIENDLVTDGVGHKIHILYNVTAMSNDKTYATITGDVSVNEFEWAIVAVPEEIPGFSPTAHIIIDTTKIDQVLLDDLEVLLYGDNSVDASLIPMNELVTMINNWFRIHIIDNGDGTWAAETEISGLIVVTGDPTVVQINDANVVYLDSETYTISDTNGPSDIT